MHAYTTLLSAVKKERFKKALFQVVAIEVGAAHSSQVNVAVAKLPGAADSSAPAKLAIRSTPSQRLSLAATRSTLALCGLLWAVSSRKRH